MSPWLGGAQYDPDEFYTRATNNHDHSERITARVRPDEYATVQAIIQSGQIPELKSDQDFTRDARIHRLQYLTESYLTGPIRERTELLLARMEQDAIAEAARAESEHWTRVIERTTEACSLKVADEDWWGLVDLLSQTEEHASVSRAPYGPRLLSICKEFRAKVPDGFDPMSDGWMKPGPGQLDFEIAT